VLGVGRKRTRSTRLKALLLGEIPSKKSSLMENKKNVDGGRGVVVFFLFLDW